MYTTFEYVLNNLLNCLQEQDRTYIEATKPWDEVRRLQKLDRASSHCKPSVRLEESLNHLMNNCKWDA